MILIALGSNLPSPAGPSFETVKAALASLRANGIQVKKVSRFYKSEAWPNPNDPPFVNAVAEVETDLAPGALLERLHEIERAFGRIRGAPNAPRALDLDIIDYNGRVEQGPPQLPHPRMAERAFVLVPLVEIAPDWHDPISGRGATDLLAMLPSDQKAAVRPLETFGFRRPES